MAKRKRKGPPPIDRFCSMCRDAVVKAEDEEKGLTSIVMVDEPGLESILALGHTSAVPAERMEADIRELFIETGPHNFGAMATHTGWAPDAVSPIKDVWIVQVVERGMEATFLLWDRERDGRWYRVGPDEVPWHALSTAATIRKWLDGDFSAPVRDASSDPGLFRVPAKGQFDILPRIKDEEGRI